MYGVSLLEYTHKNGFNKSFARPLGYDLFKRHDLRNDDDM